MNPVAFSIGSFDIKFYSLFILTGILLAWIMVSSETKKFKIEKDFTTNLIFWVVIIGLIGARVYFCLFNWEYYKTNPVEILKVWEGGLAIHGGIFAGLITLIAYCKKYKVPAYRMMDIAAPAVLLAQAIGRWGNFFNSEVYGKVVSLTQLQNMKIIPDFIIYGMEINGTFHLPLFYFESLWCLLGFILVLVIRKLKYTRLGWQAGFYMIWYGIGRFIFEGLRMPQYNLMIGYFKAAQLVSVLMILVGLIIILIQARKPKLTEMYKTNEKVEVINF